MFRYRLLATLLILPLAGCQSKCIRTVDMGCLALHLRAAHSDATPGERTPESASILAVIGLRAGDAKLERITGRAGPVRYQEQYVDADAQAVFRAKLAGSGWEGVRFAVPEDVGTLGYSATDLVLFARQAHADRLLLWSVDSDFNLYSLLDILGAIVTIGIWPIDSSCEGRAEALLVDADTGAAIHRWCFSGSTWQLGHAERGSESGDAMLRRNNARLSKRLAEEVGEWMQMKRDASSGAVLPEEWRKRGWGG